MNLNKLTLFTMGGLALAYMGFVTIVINQQPRNLARNGKPSAISIKRTADMDKLNAEAYSAFNKKNLPEAERLFRKALALEPSHDCWILLARMMDAQGRYRESLALYDAFLGPHPNWHSSQEYERAILTRYADLCDMFGRPDDATQACLKVLQTNPDPTKNYLDDSNMFVRVDTDDPTEIRARAHILTAMWLQQFSDGFANGRAETIASALSFYREAVRLKPDLPIAHYYLSQGLKHFGHKAEAQTEMARAERLGDDTFRAALTAKVRNKAEEHKRYVAYLAQQGHGHTFPINLSPVEVRQMLAKDRADHLKIMQELEAKKAKLALKDKPQPQP